MKLVYGLVDDSYKYKYGINGSDENNSALTSKEITLICARNSSAAFQMCLRGDNDFTLSVCKSPVFSPNGQLTNIRIACNFDAKGAEISSWPVFIK